MLDGGKAAATVIRGFLVAQILFYGLLYLLSINVSMVIGAVMLVIFAVTVIVATVVSADKFTARRNSKPQKAESTPLSSNRKFDRLTARVISLNTGMRAELTTPGARAEGNDINLYRSGVRVGIVRCVKHDPLKPLSHDYVKDLAKLKKKQEAEYAYLVTNAFFSEKSKKEAEKRGISLIDAQEFKALKARAKQILQEKRERRLRKRTKLNQNVFPDTYESPGYLRGHR